MKQLTRLSSVVLLVGLCVLYQPVPLQAAEIKGVRFAESIHLEEVRLPLRGMAVLKWALLFDVYAGAFYLPADHPGRDWAADVPKLLELHYFRAIAAADFASSSDQLLQRNLSPNAYHTLEPRLQQLYGLFQDVAAGDRYRLAYEPGSGTALLLNGQRLGVIPGHDFAVAYFGIWLGEQPINNKFRDRLLGLK